MITMITATHFFFYYLEYEILLIFPTLYAFYAIWLRMMWIWCAQMVFHVTVSEKSLMNREVCMHSCTYTSTRRLLYTILIASTRSQLSNRKHLRQICYMNKKPSICIIYLYIKHEGKGGHQNDFMNENAPPHFRWTTKKRSYSYAGIHRPTNGKLRMCY